MDETWALIIKSLLEYGALGFGWVLSAYFLYRDIKKKESIPEAIKAKDAIIASKDKEIKDLNDARVADLKETNDSYNDVVNSTVQTLEKLTIVLKVKTENIE